MRIDFHAHAFPDKLAGRAIAALSQSSGYLPESDGTFADTYKKMKENGTDRFVLLNIAQTPAQTHNANSFVIEHASEDVLAFAALHPFAEDAFYELDRAVDAGLKGVKFHPEYQDYDIDDKAAYPLYEACLNKGLAILFHAGYDVAYPDSRRGYPDKASRLVKDFPGAKLVLAHLGNCLDSAEALEWLCGLDCYMDLAICYKTMPWDQIRAVIKAHSADKILFGTDFPWGSIADTVSMVEQLGLTAEEKEKIYHINAEKLLDIR